MHPCCREGVLFNFVLIKIPYRHPKCTKRAGYRRPGVGIASTHLGRTLGILSPDCNNKCQSNYHMVIGKLWPTPVSLTLGQKVMFDGYFEQ